MKLHMCVRPCMGMKPKLSLYAGAFALRALSCWNDRGIKHTQARTHPPHTHCLCLIPHSSLYPYTWLRKHLREI